MAVKEITDQTFEKEVIQSSGITLVDFWAEWCGPCKMLAPTLDSLAQEFGDTMQICKVNVDQNPENATKYHVRSIPFLSLFKDGQLIESITGSKSQQDLSTWIKKHMN